MVQEIQLLLQAKGTKETKDRIIQTHVHPDWSLQR